MASDVTEIQHTDEGRFRGFDIEDDENANQIDSTDEITDEAGEEGTNETWIMEIMALKRTIEEQTATITKLREELAKRTDTVNENTEATESQSKKRKREDEAMKDVMNVAMIKDSHDKDIRIQSLTEENILLKQQKQAIDVHTQKPPVEDKATEARAPQTLPALDPAAVIEELQTSIIEKIKDVIGTLIDEKLESKLEKIEEKHSINTTQANKSFAEAVAGNLNLNTIEVAMQDAKNNERIIETERVKRDKNIILHGVTEYEGTPEEIAKQESDYVKSLLNIIGVNSKPEYIGRLGQKGNGRKRPIKLAMKTSQEKDEIMSRLVNLKNAEEEYRKISIKDDYTFQERLLVKQWLKKAEDKNQAENTDKWKVRGNPKNGFRLVKIIKTNQAETVNPTPPLQPSTLDTEVD